MGIRSRIPWGRLWKEVLLLLAAALCGGFAGGAAGFYASLSVTERSAVAPAASSTAQSLHVATSTVAFSLIPVGRPALASIAPAALTQRVSLVGSLYRAGNSGTFDDRLLGEDKLLGQAVALTSDGWFLASAGAVDGATVGQLTVWYGNKAYAVERGMIDHLNDTVFLKTAARDLPSASFSRVQDLSAGTEAWSEHRPGELMPHTILSLDARNAPNDPASSENAVRRIMLSGVSAAGDRGGALWDTAGQLIGIVESRPDEAVRVVPASGISASFSSLLFNNEIRHALLGVRAVDLADIRLAGDRGGLPATGALIRDDRKGGKPGVQRDSPAAKAKLKAGDVILKVERDILDGSADLGEVLSQYQPGASVTLRVVSGMTDTDIPVTLGTLVTGEAMK